MAGSLKTVVVFAIVSIFGITASTAAESSFGGPREKGITHSDSARHRTHGHSTTHSTDSKNKKVQPAKLQVALKK